MSFKLKIVEGPNKGAEIALPEGVAVTLGKSDDCDIVLADATLPDAPLSIETTQSGVTVGGEMLDSFAVKTIGSTSFAVGPADKVWEALKWPEEKKTTRADEKEGTSAETQRKEVQSEETKNQDAAASAPASEKKKRRGCLGCFVVLILLLLAIAALGWFFRDRDEVKLCIDKSKPYAEKVIARVSSLSGFSGASSASGSTSTAIPSSEEINPISLLENVIQRYGLVQTNRAGRIVLSGDFATRAERLKATAEAYAAEPGIELDFCDKESLITAAEDTFALVGENNLRVATATNRVLILTGTAGNLRRTLEALASDMPKLCNVDCAGITYAANDAMSGHESLDEGRAGAAGASRVSRSSNSTPSLPVCGILTTPYPCLVLKNGARVLEGAPFGDSIVMKIEADAVTLTNSTGRIVWKP